MRSFNQKTLVTNFVVAHRMGSISPVSSKACILQKKEASLTINSLKFDSESPKTQSNAKIDRS